MADLEATLTAAEVRAALDYDPKNGTFTRRWQADKSVQWNAHYPGKSAGTRTHEGYIQISVNDRRYRAHRLAWLHFHGEWPDGEIDHIDGDRANNRIANLRLATRSQQTANARRRKTNTTGYKGVSFSRLDGCYRAYIKHEGRSQCLGKFDTPEEAHAAYVAAAQEHFGEFARAE